MNKTKEKIFFTAIEMFSSVGYSECTMRELASRVGMKSASLYYYYPSKDALLDDILDFFIVADKRNRIPIETIIDQSKVLTVPEILKMLFVQYGNNEDQYYALKIIKIAIGFQFEYKKAREVFDYIFFDNAFRFRKHVFSKMIDKKIFEPFDCHTAAYTLTSYSLMRVMQSMNNNLPMEGYSDVYFKEVDNIVNFIAPLIKKVR